MSVRLLLLLLVLLPGPAFPDAGQGEFMGYRLGQDYHPTANTRERETVTRNLYIEAEHPVKPGDIDEVLLLVTPRTLTIGHINASSWFDTEDEARAFARRYIELLRAKYPDWKLGREGMDADFRIVEVNLEHPPYNLWLRLNRETHDGRPSWRCSMVLGWMPDSPEALAWHRLSLSQHLGTQDQGRKQLLDRSDLRGL